ncbi:MAG TPA: hypothetical protein PLY52_04205, partial [Methanothrix sp.]|nr:hypothetical protein [Methanothrix sp.]
DKDTEDKDTEDKDTEDKDKRNGIPRLAHRKQQRIPKTLLPMSRKYLIDNYGEDSRVQGSGRNAEWLSGSGQG